VNPACCSMRLLVQYYAVFLYNNNATTDQLRSYAVHASDSVPAMHPEAVALPRRHRDAMIPHLRRITHTALQYNCHLHDLSSFMNSLTVHAGQEATYCTHSMAAASRLDAVLLNLVHELNRRLLCTLPYYLHACLSVLRKVVLEFDSAPSLCDSLLTC
jgi:hypothetical protein